MVQVLHFIVHSVQGSGTPLYSTLITGIRYSIIQFTHYRDQVLHFTVHSLQGSGTPLYSSLITGIRYSNYTVHSLQGSGTPLYTTLITEIRYSILQYTHHRDQVLHYTVHSLQGSGTPLYSTLITGIRYSIIQFTQWECSILVTWYRHRQVTTMLHYHWWEFWWRNTDLQIKLSIISIKNKIKIIKL